MSELKTFALKNGVRLQTDIQRQDIVDRLVAFYDRPGSPEWACPWCEGDIDAVCDERDGELYEDTYGCEGDCNLLITFITPVKYGEYWKVPKSEWTVMVECGIGGECDLPTEAQP